MKTSYLSLLSAWLHGCLPCSCWLGLLGDAAAADELSVSAAESVCTPSINVTSSGDCFVNDCLSSMVKVELVDKSQFQSQLLENFPFPAGQNSLSAVVFTSQLKSKTRYPGDIRKYGSVICVQTGELSLVQQQQDKTTTASVGECLGVPANIASTLVNFGEEDVAYFVYAVDNYPINDAFYRCEPPPLQENENDVPWQTGVISCPECESSYQKYCGMYDTCFQDHFDLEDKLAPCLDECKINGQDVPTSTWKVPEREADDPRGQSMNNGKTISVEPSWTVQGGHSGLQLQLEVPSAPIPFLYNVEHTTRLVGTRSGTHSHDFTAVTCAYQGEMTLLLDKVTPVTAKAGTCYWMPAKRYMSGINTGNTTSLMWDMSVLPLRQTMAPSISIKESFDNSRNERAKAAAYCAAHDNDVPLVAATLDKCCDGTFTQNQTTAQPENWICPSTLSIPNSDYSSNDPAAATSTSCHLHASMLFPVASLFVTSFYYLFF